ncbi:glycosyltransferase [Priestia taiwanensis]|uniref:Glycosyltransferase n=1 Tax=Priestia taiwanensis TaxID=1347902 RepID=A0A917ANS2_9BACI|nr:glycosyltransferase [Priestia taiwanensis]MBM7362685.1 REP element-mobilizing transposase RayT [Priestia taiwanensis]GGE64246.1 hypothetical protein GCM10007140_13100 [Priestia taiwanensis]
MKKQLPKLMVLLAFLLFVVSPLTIEAKGKHHSQAHCFTKPSIQLMNTMRRLWTDHTTWTRSYIVSALSDLPDRDKVVERLLRNQDDIGNAIKPYYGEAASNKLAELLREHILLAGKVVEAAKSGNQGELEKYNKEWYRNADDIAVFLSKANPNWSTKELKDLLYMHLRMVTDQVVTRLKKDWYAEIIAYDQGVDHIMKIADALTTGIVKQFPNKF